MNELKPDAQEMLRLARDARSPTEADRARVQGKLALAIAAGAVGATTQAAAAQAASTGTGLVRAATLFKAGAALASIVAIAIAVRFASSSEPSVEASREPREIVAVVEEAPAPVAVVEMPEVEAPRAIAIELEAPPAIAIEVEAPPIAVVEPVAPPPRESHARREAPDLAAEIALLHEAQAAWRAGDGARTLSLVSDHEEHFPRSQFTPERTALRILASCQLGRTAEARRLGARFLRTAADSPLRRSVVESCASSE